MPEEVALVTGASGFIGRSVSRALHGAGYAVFGIGRTNISETEALDLGLREWLQAEVSIENLARLSVSPSLIIHCAGGATVYGSITAPFADYCATVQSTAEVLEYVRRFSPQAKLALCSSAAVYGNVRKLPIGVADKLGPISPYGAHKFMAETQCRAYARQFGLLISIVRLFSVFGIGLRKQLLWDACNRLSKGDAVFSGTGEETRDWIDVQDVASLLIRAAYAATGECQVFNGGRGKAIATREVLVPLARALGTENSVSFSGYERPGDPKHLVADISESLSLGWRPGEDVATQIEAYARWYKGLK